MTRLRNGAIAGCVADCGVCRATEACACGSLSRYAALGTHESLRHARGAGLVCGTTDRDGAGAPARGLLFCGVVFIVVLQHVLLGFGVSPFTKRAGSPGGQREWSSEGTASGPRAATQPSEGDTTEPSSAEQRESRHRDEPAWRATPSETVACPRRGAAGAAGPAQVETPASPTSRGGVNYVRIPPPREGWVVG